MRIFISYSSKNRELIKTLASDLKALGHEVWFDAELTGGQLWWDNILEQIRDCDLLIAALTPQSMMSEPCRLERDYAYALNKRILPVLVADGVRVNLLPPELSLLHFVDYRKPDDKMTAIALSRALDSLPDAQPLPDELPIAPPPPINSLSELAHKVSARELDFQMQTAALVELKSLLDDEDIRADVLELLSILRKRPDLFAAVANEIDGVLGSPAPSVDSHQIATPTFSGEEEVLKEFGARLHTSTLVYAGKIALTKHRLVFQGEYLTKSQRLEIPIADILDVRKGVALFSASPTIIVRTRDGKEHSFSIQAFAGLLYGNREEIITLIQGLISRP